jgi:ABC-type Zn uptake system ZnuABC Zn-binding protein ZnuA
MRDKFGGQGARLARQIFALLASGVIFGCAPAGDSSNATPTGDETSATLRIATTTLPLADWAQQVAGPGAKVTCILPSGANAHTFEPSPREMRTVAEASMLLRIGLHLDDWSDGLASANREIKSIAVGDLMRTNGLLPDVTSVTIAATSIEPDGIEATHDLDNEKDQSHDDDHDEVHDHDHDHGDDGTDPHFWLDPLLAREAVTLIAEQLALVHPEQAATFRANAEAYNARLRSLHEDIQTTLSTTARHDFATFHNAFAYYASRYGLQIAAVIEEYPGKEPGDRYLRGVVEKLRAAGIRSVFAEPQFSRRAAEIIAREIGGQVAMLDPHGTADAPPRDTYIGMMTFNTEAIAKALNE